MAALIPERKTYLCKTGYFRAKWCHLENNDKAYLFVSKVRLAIIGNCLMIVGMPCLNSLSKVSQIPSFPLDGIFWAKALEHQVNDEAFLIIHRMIRE